MSASWSSQAESGDTSLGFEFPAGPVTPKPEKIAPATPRKAPRRKASATASRPKPKKPSGGGDGGPRPRTTVPKVPLVKA